MSAAGLLVEAIRRAATGARIQAADIMLQAAKAMHPDAGARSRIARSRAVAPRDSGPLAHRGRAHESRDRRAAGLAEKTVKNYVSGLLAKLGMERRTQAAVYGAERKHQPD